MIAIRIANRTVAYTARFWDAKAIVLGMGVAHIEDDADYPDCADALMLNGDIATIQPLNFKLN